MTMNAVAGRITEDTKDRYSHWYIVDNCNQIFKLSQFTGAVIFAKAYWAKKTNKKQPLYVAMLLLQAVIHTGSEQLFTAFVIPWV